MEQTEIERIKGGVGRAILKEPKNQILRDLETSILTVEQLQAKLDAAMAENAKLRAEVKLMEDEGHKLIDSQMQRAEAAEKALHDVELQNRELKEELQHQKELWVVALPQLHALDDRAGIIRFGQLHDPQGSIDTTLAQKPKCDGREVCWFAEVNQESKAACSVCKDLTWPRWYCKDEDRLTNDPNEAKRFACREDCHEFCIRARQTHWHLYPTEHVFIEKRICEGCGDPEKFPGNTGFCNDCAKKKFL